MAWPLSEFGRTRLTASSITKKVDEEEEEEEEGKAMKYNLVSGQNEEANHKKEVQLSL